MKCNELRLNLQFLHLICINLASLFFLQFGHVNKENTLDRMDESTNLNPVGNIESFGSQLTQL